MLKNKNIRKTFHTVKVCSTCITLFHWCEALYFCLNVLLTNFRNSDHALIILLKI